MSLLQILFLVVITSFAVNLASAHLTFWMKKFSWANMADSLAKLEVVI
jgi:hypothetical protein